MNNDRFSRNSQNVRRYNDILNDNIQNIVEDVINEYLTIPSRRPITPNVRSRPNIHNNNTQGETYVEYMSLLHALRDIITGYNTNIREYNQNINMSLQLLISAQYDLSRIRTQQFGQQSQPENPQPEQSRSQIPENPLRRNNRTTSPTTFRPADPIPTQVNNLRTNRNNVNRDGTSINNLASQLLGNLLTPSRTSTPIERTINSAIYRYFPSANFQDVVVYPTAEQINTATEQIEYINSGSNSTNCPITLDDFEEGEQVTRILHCGHIFKKSAIDNWFCRNVRCPVCRYDIREYVRPTQVERSQQTPPITPTTSTNNLTSSINEPYLDYETEEDDSDDEYREAIEPVSNIITSEDTDTDSDYYDNSMNTHTTATNSLNDLLNEVTNNFNTLIQNYNRNANTEMYYSIEVTPISLYDLSMNLEVD
jgi:hypothetical protein